MSTKPRLQLILSPAKTMNFAPCNAADNAMDGISGEPVGLERVNELAHLMAQKSKAELKEILGVSDAIADENFERFQSWDDAEPRQAVVAYSGFAYAKLDARSLDEEQLRVGQKRMLILSGMWGPVRPLDGIKPYRLEMACKKLAPPYNKLAQYWRDLSTETLLESYGNGDGRVLINVASDEYAAAIDFEAVKEAGVQVVKVEFWQGGKKAPTVRRLRLARVPSTSRRLDSVDAPALTVRPPRRCISNTAAASSRATSSCMTATVWRRCKASTSRATSTRLSIRATTSSCSRATRRPPRRRRGRSKIMCKNLVSHIPQRGP